MTKHTCETCGATLPAPGAACARCLMELAARGEHESRSEPATTRAPRSGPPPEPGELAPLFPELEIEGLIGAGGMGAVYKARQRQLGRDVALKVLHGELSGDPVFVERFLREARAMARLTHPGIVSVFDFGERGGRCWLLMELVKGTNLRALMKSSDLASRPALSIVRQLCEALQYAHDEGVVHRDIKPENVIVDARGVVKVADFGLAKLVDQPADTALTEVGTVMGTPHYMAPEQIEHPRDVDHRADIYSLGVVFYELLTGELPIGRFAPPSKRVEVDVRLDEIVLKSLEHERERRYQSAVEVKTDVERVQRSPPRPKAEKPKLYGVQVSRRGVRVRWVKERPGAVGWTVIFLFAWALAGWSFNLGPTLFALVSLTVLGILFFAVVDDRTRGEAPETETGLLRSLSGAALFVLGFGALFATYVVVAERGTWHYVSSDQSIDAGIEIAERDALALFPHIGVGSRGPVRVEVQNSYQLDNPDALFRIPWYLLAAAALASFAAAAVVLANTRKPPPRGNRGVVEALALFLLPMAFAWTTTSWRREDPNRGPMLLEREAYGTADEIAAKLYAGFVRRGLAVHADANGRILADGMGENTWLRSLSATPSSPFECWRIGLRGPMRRVPHTLAVVVSSGNRAFVRLDAGEVDRSGDEVRDWSADLERLLDEACGEAKPARDG